MTEKERDETEQELDKKIQELCLLHINAEISSYRLDVFIRSFSIIIVSVFCMVKSPANSMNIFRMEIPAPIFYIMIAVVIVSAFAYGVVGYVRGQPLYDIENAIETRQIDRAISVREDMHNKKKKFDLLDNVFFYVFALFLFMPSWFGYHAECPFCKAEISASSSICDECGSDTDFDKDIVKYITAEF